MSHRTFIDDIILNATDRGYRLNSDTDRILDALLLTSIQVLGGFYCNETALRQLQGISSSQDIASSCLSLNVYPVASGKLVPSKYVGQNLETGGPEYFVGLMCAALSPEGLSHLDIDRVRYVSGKVLEVWDTLPNEGLVLESTCITVLPRTNASVWSDKPCDPVEACATTGRCFMHSEVSTDQ